MPVTVTRNQPQTYIKRVREAVENKDKEAAVAALQVAIPVIDKTATKGVIHKSNASRSVSRLTKLVNTLANQFLNKILKGPRLTS